MSFMITLAAVSAIFVLLVMGSGLARSDRFHRLINREIARVHDSRVALINQGVHDFSNLPYPNVQASWTKFEQSPPWQLNLKSCLVYE